MPPPTSMHVRSFPCCTMPRCSYICHILHDARCACLAAGRTCRALQGRWSSQAQRQLTPPGRRRQQFRGRDPNAAPAPRPQQPQPQQLSWQRLPQRCQRRQMQRQRRRQQQAHQLMLGMLLTYLLSAHQSQPGKAAVSTEANETWIQMLHWSHLYCIGATYRQVFMLQTWPGSVQTLSWYAGGYVADAHPSCVHASTGGRGAEPVRQGGVEKPQAKARSGASNGLATQTPAASGACAFYTAACS